MTISIQTAGRLGRSLVSSQWFWYGVSASALTALTLLPVAMRWDKQVTLWAFGGTAIAGSAAWMLSKEVEQSATKHIIKREVGFQIEVDETVHMLNTARALMAQEIQLIEADGQHNPLALPGMPSLPALPSAGMGMQQMQQMDESAIAGTPESILPEEDLAETIANSPEDELNFLIVGKSRSGKTSLIVNAIKRKHDKLQGMIDLWIANGKPERGNRWGGLVDSPFDYIAVNSLESALDMLSTLQSYMERVQRWQVEDTDHAPALLVFDEVNNQRIVLGKKEAERSFDPTISLFATQCMSEKSGLWLSTHSHIVEDVGLNRQLQQSFQIFALGRNGKYQSIEAVIGDQIVIRSKETRDRLKAQLSAYVKAGGKGAIAFTDQDGVPRLVRLPYYSKDIQIKGNALNSPAADILTGDSGNVPAEFRQSSGDVPQSADETPRNADLSTEKLRQQLQRCMNAEFQDLSRNGFDFDKAQNPVEPLEKRLSQCRNDFEKVMECKRSGLNQKQTIFAVWGVNAGESTRYEEARVKYQAIASEIRDSK